MISRSNAFPFQIKLIKNIFSVLININSLSFLFDKINNNLYIINFKITILISNAGWKYIFYSQLTIKFDFFTQDNNFRFFYSFFIDKQIKHDIYNLTFLYFRSSFFYPTKIDDVPILINI